MPANVSEKKGTTGSQKVAVKLDKPKWLKVEGDSYEVDHVINAYITGKESALKDLAKTIERQRDQILIKGMELTDNLLEKLDEDLGVNFVEARLKQSDIFNVETLILLEKESYLSDKLDKIYELYFEFEEQIDIDFDFEVKFTFSSDYINDGQLQLDGFEYFRN